MSFKTKVNDFQEYNFMWCGRSATTVFRGTKQPLEVLILIPARDERPKQGQERDPQFYWFRYKNVGDGYQARSGFAFFLVLKTLSLQRNNYNLFSYHTGETFITNSNRLYHIIYWIFSLSSNKWPGTPLYIILVIFRC